MASEIGIGAAQHRRIAKPAGDQKPADRGDAGAQIGGPLLHRAGVIDKGKRVVTRVAELAAEQRREEIARMLAGAEITAEARAAAERLIKAAAG